MLKRSEIVPGAILRENFNGMSEFYEVLSVSEKSVQLQQLEWTTRDVEVPEGEVARPFQNYRYVKIKKDENDNWVTQGKPFTKRIQVIGQDDGEDVVKVTSKVYKGFKMHREWNPERAFEFYWG